MACRVYLFVFCSLLLVNIGTSFNMKYVIDRLSGLETKLESEIKRRRLETETFEAENKQRRSETEELFRMISELTNDKMRNKNEHASRDEINAPIQQSTSLSPLTDNLKTTELAVELKDHKSYINKGAAIEKAENVKLRSELQNMSKQLEIGIIMSESRIDEKIRNFTNYVSDKQTSLVTVHRFNNLSELVTKISTTSLSELRRETIEALSSVKFDIETSIRELSNSLLTMNQTILKSVEKLNNCCSSLSPTTLLPNTINSKPTETPISLKSTRPTSCKSASDRNGVLSIYPETLQNPIEVYCDQTTDDGGWLVIQRRKDGSENFYRSWADYKTGFGNPDGEFWIGNDILHALTSAGLNQLRIDMEDFEGNKAFAKYSHFKVQQESQLYQLEVNGYSGNVSDSLTSRNGDAFSTKDRDNDKWYGGSCSEVYRGAWWYGICSLSNLNGRYYHGGNSPDLNGIFWYYWKKNSHYSMKTVEMKIR